MASSHVRDNSDGMICSWDHLLVSPFGLTDTVEAYESGKLAKLVSSAGKAEL